jgi:hypothetical protein
MQLYAHEEFMGWTHDLHLSNWLLAAKILISIPVWQEMLLRHNGSGYNLFLPESFPQTACGIAR